MCFTQTAWSASLQSATKEPLIAKRLIFQNRSILKCGFLKGPTILTFVDVKALLAISNLLSRQAVPLTTDWINLTKPKLNLNKITSKTPKDILRVLLLCLNWEDSQLANIYSISDEELKKYTAQVRREKPWSMYDSKLQNKIEEFSDSYLEKLVDMVLRAESAEKTQGSLEQNQSLKAIGFSWLL